MALEPPYALPGLDVTIDQLKYCEMPLGAQSPLAHTFVYFLTVRNQTPQQIQILGRRWILSQRDGCTFVLEGQGVVGKLPVLEPGQQFSYHSYHLIGQSTLAMGSFHGLDENGKHVFLRIPPFEMIIPPASH